MFDRITAEQAGISSEKVADFISTLERRGLVTHSVLLMKGDRIYGEYYWAPFDRDFCHRMYSQTKSYVAIAIGLLEEDGLLNLDDTIASHFPEKAEQPMAEYLDKLTIRQMLTMTTCGYSRSWVGDPDQLDRTRTYLGPRSYTRPAGTIWEYDSTGSQVMGTLVEKITGKSLFDFLYERIFSHLGTFKTAEILKFRNGDSWSDSALVCTPRDMASFGRLLMKGGNWNGKQLINSAYVAKATSAVVDNRENCHGNVFAHGYGYQIWRTEQNSFAFNGMGCQFTICTPDKDLLLVITGDNQGNGAASNIIVGAYMDLIVSSASENALPEDEKAEAVLESAASDLKLKALSGKSDTPFRTEIDGKTYFCEANNLGMTKFRFDFKGDEGEFSYTNAQGDKVIPFGVNKNVFGKFPELGYSDGVGGVRIENGFMYNDAVSLCWTEEKKLWMFVQIIDRYFGNFSACFAFDGDMAVCKFTKTAEDFLERYEGGFKARRLG
ncbi:MAG: serine hydrolase [Clostridia bacterium]|nr:serine hydrolase [Clostridia bacterium]